jgi:hypothetical protein
MTRRTDRNARQESDPAHQCERLTRDVEHEGGHPVQMAEAKVQRRRKTARELWYPDVEPRGKEGYGIQLTVQAYPGGSFFFVSKHRKNPMPYENAAQACGAFAEILDLLMKQTARKNLKR